MQGHVWARGRALAVALCVALLLAACGGGSGDGDCDGDSGPFFVSDSYQYRSHLGQVGRPFSLAPSNPPGLCKSHYAASGLPAGLTIDQGTGVISGVPTTAGTFAVTVTLSSPAYSGSVSRSFSLTIDPFPAAPNGWTLLNASSRLPQPGETYAASIGGQLFAMAPAATSGSLNLTVSRSSDGGARWQTMPGSAQAFTRSAFSAFKWATPTSDGQAVYIVSYENTASSPTEPVLFTRRFDGTSWVTRQAVQAPPKRGGYSVVAMGGALYLIGGQPGNWVYDVPLQQNGWTYTNEVWRSVDEGLTWQQVTATGTALPARAGHCTVAANGALYVYGGHDSTQQRTDLWRSTDGATWSQVGSSGPYAGSATRSAWMEVCAAHGDTLQVVFDSYSHRGSLGTQVGYFQLSTGAWVPDGLLPIADRTDSRRFHPGLVSHGGKLLLVGGGCGPSSCSVGRDDAWSR